MKKTSVFLICFATLAISSCSLLSGAASTTAGSTGSSAARSLVGLYNSRQTNGSISITNSNDLANILNVITAAQQLKANSSDAQYKTNFIAGLVNGGSGMITSASATNIVNSILGSTAFSNVNATNIAQKAETVSAIITLLNMLK